MAMTPSFNPAHNNTGQHLRAGVLSTGVIQVIKVLCSFASVVVLSRLLPPSDFGVVAMVGPVVAFIGLFQDLGLSQATVQKQSITHEEVNAFFWINVVLGLVLALTVAAISPLVGWYYKDERVVALTIAMGALIFLGSCGGQHGALLSRRMEFHKSAMIDGVSTVLSLGIAIACALTLKNYWALYWATLAGTAISLAGAWIASGWRPSLPRRTSGIKGMLKFGAGITSFNFMNFFARNLDNVLIGRVWGDQALGLYDRAYKLLLFPLQRVVWPLSGIMVPLLSRLLSDPDHYRQTFLKVVAQMTFIAWPGILWALVYADTMIPTALGEQWIAATPIFKPLAVATFMQMLAVPTGWLFVSQGRAKDYVKVGFINTMLCVIGFVIGLPYGPVGMAIGYAAGEAVRIPIAWWYVSRRGEVQTRHVLFVLYPHYVGCVFSVIVLLACLYGLSEFSKWVSLGAGLVAAYAAMTLGMLCFARGRETLVQSINFALQSLGMKKRAKEAG